jgi:hypothetical protein
MRKIIFKVVIVSGGDASIAIYYVFSSILQVYEETFKVKKNSKKLTLQERNAMIL